MEAMDVADQLTPLGNILARLPIEPRMGRMMVLGAGFGSDSSLPPYSLLSLSPLHPPPLSLPTPSSLSLLFTLLLSPSLLPLSLSSSPSSSLLPYSLLSLSSSPSSSLPPYFLLSPLLHMSPSSSLPPLTFSLLNFYCYTTFIKLQVFFRQLHFFADSY